MPSRRQLNIISNTRAASVDDINAIYHVLNGSYSNASGVSAANALRGHGMSVQLTGYDGRLTSPDGVLGSLDTTRYALEVRNRESTARRTAAFRDYDNTVVAEVRAGYLRAIDTASSVSTAAPVIVSGTLAGGVLTGTYPNPSFSATSLELLLKPTMIVAWYGAYTVTARTDGGPGYNNEVTDAPGWVFCDGSFYGVNTNVRLRAGGTIVPPNMANTLPIGAGTIAHQGTGGTAWASLASVSTPAHNHGFTHEHSGPSHDHGLNSHTHGFTATHQHTTPTHSHTLSAHIHNQTTHVHSIGSHTHSGSSLAYSHVHSHKHSTSAHQHGLAAHNHDSGTYELTNKTTGAAQASNPFYDEDETGSTHITADTSHYHIMNDGDVKGVSSDGHYTSGGSDFTATSNNTSPADTGIEASATPSSTSWSGTTSTPSADNTGGISGSAGDTSTPSPDYTDTSGSGVSGLVSPGTSDGAVGSTAAGGTATTTAQSNNSTTSQTSSTFNAQPPVRAWYWIMKL